MNLDCATHLLKKMYGPAKKNITRLNRLQRGDLESSEEREGRCMGYTRRSMLEGMGIAGLGALVPSLVKKATAFSRMQPLASGASSCPFKLAVINDEITQDFEKACQIVSGDFGLHWIELRSMWNKNVTELEPRQMDDARKILAEAQAASHGYREPAVQDGLARSAAIVSERKS